MKLVETGSLTIILQTTVMDGKRLEGDYGLVNDFENIRNKK